MKSDNSTWSIYWHDWNIQKSQFKWKKTIFLQKHNWLRWTRSPSEKSRNCRWYRWSNPNVETTMHHYPAAHLSRALKCFQMFCFIFCLPSGVSQPKATEISTKRFWSPSWQRVHRDENGFGTIHLSSHYSVALRWRTFHAGQNRTQRAGRLRIATKLARLKETVKWLLITLIDKSRTSL